MAKILCNHEMGTTRFVCKDPDHSDGRPYGINVVAGLPAEIDERVVAEYPSVFFPVPVAEDAVEEEIADDEPMVVEEAEEEAVVAEYDLDGLHEAALADQEMIDKIESFTAKKKLDEFAAGIGVELDRRKKLVDMKSMLREALDI
jgi:hypothetical protein